MRILYILTENGKHLLFFIVVVVYCCCLLLAAPTSELVKRVRELYQRSNSDVRFLIPVLHGLTKVY